MFTQRISARNDGTIARLRQLPLYERCKQRDACFVVPQKVDPLSRGDAVELLHRRVPSFTDRTPLLASIQQASTGQRLA